MHVVEHGLVRIADEIVALDFGLCLAGQDFGVAWVGKPLVVPYGHLAAERLVSEHHAGGHECLPEERHQRFAAFLRRRACVPRAGHVDLVDAGFRLRRVGNHRIESAKELLDAHAVERDEDDVAVVRRGRGRGQREAAEERCADCRESIHLPLPLCRNRRIAIPARITRDCRCGKPGGGGCGQFTPLITRS